MAENETVFTFGGKDAGLSKLIKDLTASVNTLNTTVADLGDNLQKATVAQRNYAKAARSTAKSTQTTQKSVKELSSALAKTGRDAQNSLRKINVSTIRKEFAQLSANEIVKLNERLREAGVSLKDFMDEGGRSLRAASIEQFSQSLEELANDSKTSLSTVKLLRKELSSGGDSQFADDLLNYKAVQTQADAILGEISQIQKKLGDIGPAAASGNQQAIDEFNDLYKTLERVTQRAEDLRQELQQAGQRAQGAFASQNQSLDALGFRQIKLSDIFPTQEQQKVAQLQAKIDQAVRDSVQEGAVKRTLNFFLSQDKALQSVDRNVVALTSHLPRLRYALYDVSNTATIFGASIIAGIGATVKFAADYERAFADVIRTTGVTGGEIDKLKNELIDLSQRIPVAFGDLAEIATLAGQLNIANNVVDQFTETVAKFSATTDVTIEAAATAFGRLDQLVEGVNGQFEKLGSSILKVGVNAVATESDIINIATQIASIANIAGFSADELIGLSSALASVGTRPELARGTFTRLFTEINQAVTEGGDQLNKFSRIAGQSQDQFIQAWGEGSGAEQVLAILRGLNILGKDAELALRDVGITSVRDVPTILKLAQSFEEVQKQLDYAKLGFDEGTELQEQYGVITSTLSEQLQVLQNNLGAITAALGSAAGPLSLVVENLNRFLRVVEEVLKNPVGQVVFTLASAFGAILGVSALAVGAMARFGGSLAGAGTAMIELFETITFTKIQVDQLTNSQDNAALSNLRKVATDKQNIAAERAKSLATTKSTLTTNNAVVSTIRYNTSLTAQRARLISIRSSIDAYIARTRLAGAVALNAARQTRAWGLAVKSLKATFGFGVFLAFSYAVEAIVKQFDKLNESTKSAEERFENWGEITEAVRKDSEAFAKSTEDQADQFQVVGTSIGEAGEEVSDYSKILAVTSGEQDALNRILDESANRFDRQTVAIGKNTQALLRQKLAREILEAGAIPAAPVLFGGGEISAEEYFANAPAPSAVAGAGGALVSQIALSEVLKDLNLTEELTKAGFDIKEFSDLVVEGNTSAANSYANKLGPAAQEVIDLLESRNPELYGLQIQQLGYLVSDGAGALETFTSSGSEVIKALNGIAIQAAITGVPMEEVAGAADVMDEAFKSITENIYGPINAQRQLQESLVNLGEVIYNEGSTIAATSTELQDVLNNIWETSGGGEQAAKDFAGFYNAIVEGGQFTAEELEHLQEVVLETYRTFGNVTVETLKAQRLAFSQSVGNLNAARGASRAAIRARQEAQAELDRFDKDIAALEESLNNFDFGDYGSDFDLTPLEIGFDRAGESAGDAKDEVEELTEEVRTLTDYASDLESVFSRAFDLRFARGIEIDAITAAWENFTEQVADAGAQLEELLATQEDLTADRAIKEYFLSVADAYGDTLRAAKLRAEITELDRKQAENAREIADAQSEANQATSLSGEGPQSRENRGALLDLVRNYQRYITTLAETGATQDELRDATANARQEFIQQATELGFQESVVLEYAQAFDDVTYAINNVPRNITVDFNSDPAIQALNELNAKLNQSIEKAKELQRVSGQSIPQGQLDPAKAVRRANLVAEIDALIEKINDPRGGTAGRATLGARIAALQAKLASGNYASGGYTGRGGKYQPAGIVHRGEYVVPSQHVNQTTGFPSASFLASIQNGVRSYANGGFVGGGDGTMMVELSPYDRKLLQDAGNVQLRVNGRVLAETTNTSNYNEARRGSN